MSTYAEELFTPRSAHADQFAAAALHAVETLPNGSRVLDIGCGSGDLIKRAQRTGVSFVGVDISRPNIEAAKAIASDADFHCVDFLNFEAGQFDVVFANSVFHLVDCLDQTLASALSRSVKAGGLLIAAMPLDSPKNQILSLQRRVWNLTPRSLDGLIGSAASAIMKDTNIASRTVYLRAAPTRLLSNGFLASMERTGLKLLSQQRMSADHFLKLDHAIAIWRKATADQAPYN